MDVRCIAWNFETGLVGTVRIDENTTYSRTGSLSITQSVGFGSVQFYTEDSYSGPTVHHRNHNGTEGGPRQVSQVNMMSSLRGGRP